VAAVLPAVVLAAVTVAAVPACGDRARGAPSAAAPAAPAPAVEAPAGGAPAGAAARDLPQGSADRAAVLDAVRRPLEAELGQPVRFEVDRLRAQGDWAFLTAVPRRAAGGRLRYAGTRYAAAVEAGAFDEVVSALVRRDAAGRWRVVVYDLGATDVVWERWPAEHGAPRAVFPFP
jgi:hypothetical protein